MTTSTSARLDLLRARMAAAVGGRMPGHIERLGWNGPQLAGWQRARLRALLARAIDRSPFHAARLAGIDPARFELADLPRLPVMTKAQMMERFDEVVTDRRLTQDLADRHIAASAAEPALLLGDYVCLVSGGSSGLRGIFVQTAEEYAEFAASATRRAMAAFLAGGGHRAEGMVIGMVGAASPVHSSGMAAATATGPPIRMVSAPATWPTARIIERLNAAQPPALIGYATRLAELAREQSAGRLRLRPRGVTSISEMLTPGDREAIEAASAPLPRWGFFDQQGRQLCETDLTDLWREVGPCLAITRIRLQEILLTAAARVPCRLGVALTGLTQHGHRASVTFADGSAGEYDLVVGADGINSTVRRLAISPLPPQYADTMIWRSIIPARPPAPIT